MRFISFLFLFIALTASVLAQENSIPGKGPVNQYDADGKMHGTWLLSSGQKMGEPDCSEFGTFYHGRKTGQWYKMNESGELLSIETYKNDVRDGEAQYFEQGKLYCTGTYRGLNPSQPFDTFLIDDPVTQLESLKSVAAEKGYVRHGMWRYYDTKTGRMIKEEEYQVDELIYRKDIIPSPDTDSAERKRERSLPHNKQAQYQPPPGKKPGFTDPTK